MSKIFSKDFFEGIKDGIPICLGYFSVSMAFGLTAVLSGIPIWAAVLISLTNVTSAGQFAGINILVAQGTMIELALTTFIINIRYFLMSLTVSQKVESKMKMRERLGIAFGITDEIFAVSVQRKKDLSGDYMTGLILTPVMGWTLGTLTGAVATSFMPKTLSDAMGIALYGMFIAIIIPPARENKNVLFTVVLAVILSLLFTYIPGINKLSGGWSIIIITIVVSMIAALLFPIEETKEIES
ncbi:MAG: AzlC family ABC transporter permease [Lachnospiraceae bacterium]|nr:AzlC family ABC transporter permease [Lachnospiraceae bacterium]